MNKSNYLLDLPDDIITLIYKSVFNSCLKHIDNNNAKTLYDFYNILEKSKLSYCIISNNFHNIYLYRKYYIKDDNKLSKIKYIEYPILFITSNFEYIQTIIEDFARIIYNDHDENRMLMKIHRKRSGIYNLQFTGNSFRVYVDKNKLLCRVDLEKAIILGYELFYYSLKLINILELNPYDDYEDINGIYEWLNNYRSLEGYIITNNIVAVELGI
jgi:hypothetical protein